MTPKVSVCIPTYNRLEMFRATLWSVLRQTYQDFEVIVSDNASEENIEAEVLAAKDLRVRYFRQEKSIGSVANFRFLQALPKGEYVLFLCSDDLLLPDCLARAVGALAAQPYRGGVVYMGAHYGAEGFQFLSSMPARDFATAAEYAEDGRVREFTFVSPSMCMYRRRVFERLGGWNPHLLAVIDWDLYSRMVRIGGGVVFLHDVLAVMRLHPDRHSNTTALHWDFFHDVMLLSAEPEHRLGPTFRARVLVEQLLWDWRLKRSPLRTLKHAASVKGFPKMLLYVPWEIFRRLGLKVGRLFGRRTQCNATSSFKVGRAVDLNALDSFWKAAEVVRAGGHSE